MYKSQRIYQTLETKNHKIIFKIQNVYISKVKQSIQKLKIHVT